VAGIGNIYADESLFDAGIHPTTRIDKLTDAELKTLGRMVISNLADASAQNRRSGVHRHAQPARQARLPRLRPPK
jgi:formamidopyrimidine-DNA glycosylase